MQIIRNGVTKAEPPRRRKQRFENWLTSRVAEEDENLSQILDNKDESAMFDLANNFAIRHHNPKTEDEL